jgi:glycosyltransferase involved in cell wall biosynthesis
LFESLILCSLCCLLFEFILHSFAPVPFRRVGFISTRFAGTDGVSFEAGKWARLFEAGGAECFWFAGQLDTPRAASHLAPEAFFNHPAVLEIQAGLFGVTERTPEVTRRVEEMTSRLGAELRAFIARFGIDLLVVQNALAIPMHVPLGLALAEVIAETGLPTIAHHHDFAWERERFAVNAAADYLATAFPPRLSGMAHVVINSRQRAALAERLDLEATVVPNVLDFDAPPPEPDAYARGFRRDIGVADDETLVLQPTRIIARKGIAHSIELVRRLADRRAVLVLTHPAGDEGMEALRGVEAGIARAGIRAIFLSGRIGQTRGMTADGRKIYTLADVYPHADFVTYPSSWEGFGNALLEAVYFGRPVLVNRYPVYVSDIAPTGLRVVEMDGAVTDAVVAEVRNVLDDAARQREWARENAEIGRKHFSIALARERLTGICVALARRLATPAGES